MRKTKKSFNLTINDNRKIKVFLFILILTSIIWFLIELSKVSTSSTNFMVEYSNLPEGKLLQNKPISEISIELKATGFSLLKYKIKKHKITLRLNNISKSSTNYFLLPNKQLFFLNSQLKGETEAVNILNDTIFIALGKNKVKKVPVVLDLDIKFKLGYNFVEEIKIMPDSVIVTGPEKIIDSIYEIKTKSIKLKDVYEDINRELEIKMPSKNNIYVSVKKVNIRGRVDKFTEGKLTIPVTVINVPDGVNINTYPKEIEVIYQAGLSNFNDITVNSFQIVYDFMQYKNDTLIQHLNPVIKQKSDFISSIKIIPAQIEFLIQQ